MALNNTFNLRFHSLAESVYSLIRKCLAPIARAPTIPMKKFLITFFCFSTIVAFATAATTKRETLVKHLDSCEAILQDLQSSTKTAIPADILQRAKGIVIVNSFQGGFFLGVKDGYAVALVRRANGKWSVPAFLRAGELSFGLQAGGRSTSTVLVLMDDSTPRLLFKQRFNFGAEAKAAAGIRAADTEAVTKRIRDEANVLVYTLSEGYYLGAAIKTGHMSPNEDANQTFYNTNHRMPELLYSDWVQPPVEAKFIMDYVTRITSR